MEATLHRGTTHTERTRDITINHLTDNNKIEHKTYTTHIAK